MYYINRLSRGSVKHEQEFLGVLSIVSFFFETGCESRVCAGGGGVASLDALNDVECGFNIGDVLVYPCCFLLSSMNWC